MINSKCPMLSKFFLSCAPGEICFFLSPFFLHLLPCQAFYDVKWSSYTRKSFSETDSFPMKILQASYCSEQIYKTLFLKTLILFIYRPLTCDFNSILHFCFITFSHVCCIVYLPLLKYVNYFLKDGMIMIEVMEDWDWVTHSGSNFIWGSNRKQP